MLEALSTIGDLCDDMKEARQMCKRLQTRLKVAYNEFHKLEFLPPGVVEKYVDVAAKYLQFLQLYHGKQLVYRVAEHSTLTDKLRQIYEEVAELFELAGIAFSNWGDEWNEDHRLLKNVLAAIVEDSASVLRELQTSRAQAEALWTLKFEIERRGERHDDDLMRLMKSMLATVILASRTMDEHLPDWFLPLYEVGFESNHFAGGSFGAVHRGVSSDRTNVAIKFFLVDDEEIDERAQRHLEKEFSLLFLQRHTNVMSVFGASHISSQPFLVYELATNGNLGTFLAHSDGNKNRMWRLLHEAALGLAHLHSNNIVHGDLKLSNILIDAGMHAKLSDFGLSTMRACSIRSRTNQRATASGGLRWRAPECLKRQPTRASDVYSFAMCMIEAANGEPPFAFLSDDDVRDNVRKGEIPEKPEAMTDEMWELVLAMTRLDPAKRTGLNHVLDKLKYFAEVEVAGKLKDLEDAHKVAPMAVNDDTRRSSVPVLVNAISSTRGEELEGSLLRLVVECVEDEQQSQLYEANSVLILVELVKHGGTRFIQLSALLCLSWVVQFDSNLTKQEFELLGKGIREMTAQELADLKCILRDGNDQDKLKAAVYCTGVSAITKGEELQDSELCSLFVALLRNGADVLKLWATIAVGKLATNDTNRSNFANEGAIASLFVLLQSGIETQKLWAAYALANVCQDNGTNSVATANCGAISQLMALLQEGTERQKEFAALALGQLALANDNSCVMISSAGAIAPLVSLLRSGNGKQKERAGFALGGLMSRSVDNCTALEVEGGVELLVSLLINGSDDQKESAAFALGTFVARGDVKSNATELEQAVSYLVSLLASGSDTQKELAALTLGTFSVGTDVNTLAVAMERAVASLVNLLRDGLNGPREQAAFALSHFAGMNEASRAAIARAGSIPVLISLLQDGTNALKEHAVLGLGNLALTNTPNGAEIARAGAIPLFIALLQDGTKTQKVYAALAMGNLAIGSQAQSVAIANGGGLPLLMTLLRTGTEEMKEGAAFALARLAVNEANCMLMVHDGAIPLLVALIQSGNDRQTEQAAYALSEFADKNYQNCESIASEGGIPPLVALLSAGTGKQKEYAAMALSFICGEDELDDHRVAISRAGAISPLVSVVSSGTDPQKRWAALALGSLAVKDEANCAVIAREGAIPPLVALLWSPLDRQKENAAFAVGRLAAYSDEADVITALEEAILPLVELLRAGTDAQKEEAAFALGHISLKSEASSAAIARNGAISLLASQLRSGTDKEKAYATMALVNLADGNRKIHADVIHEGAIGLLVQIERTGAEAQKKWAAYSLGRLAFKSHEH